MSVSEACSWFALAPFKGGMQFIVKYKCGGPWMSELLAPKHFLEIPICICCVPARRRHCSVLTESYHVLCDPFGTDSFTILEEINCSMGQTL